MLILKKCAKNIKIREKMSYFIEVRVILINKLKNSGFRVKNAK